MKNSILEIIKNDARVKEITGYFEEQFLKGYNLIKDKDKILNIKDTLFRRWYYSAMLQLTYLNPSFLINEIAQNKIKGDYVVMPHIKPEFHKGNEVKFTYSYKYFSVDEHPVVEDLITLVEFSNPSVHMDFESGFVLQNGEKLLEEINYRNAYYLIYLLELAKEMKLMKEMPSIGTVCLTPSKGYDQFLKLSKEEQLHKVVDKSIDISVKKFNEQSVLWSQLNRKKIIDMLDNRVLNDKYLNEIDKNINNMEDFIEEAKKSGAIELAEETLNSDLGELSEILSETYFGIFIDMWFISVFGYYLGVITPNYVDLYDVCGNMKELVRCQDDMEKLGYMFDMDQAHDLTPLGEKIMSSFKKIEDKKNFNKVKEHEFDEMLVQIREEMKLVLSGELDDSMEDMMNMFKDYMEEFEDDDE